MISDDLDPLPVVLPPEGVVARRIREVAARGCALEGGRLDVAGVRGCGVAAGAAATSRAGRRVVLVVEDLESARRTAQDVGFFLGSGREDAEDTGEGDVLVLAASESSPYADISPDRRAAMSRLATLSHLAQGRPWRVLVVPASALARKAVPRADLAKRSILLAKDSEIDRERFLRTLADDGYLRVPLVEDPGTFGVRGAVLDVWPPSSDSPVRVELYGDLVLSLRSFDPAAQKTCKDAGELRQIWLPPVREAILDTASIERARARVTDLAEAMDHPTIKTRALVDDIVGGRPFFGAEGFLPAYYEALDPFFEYVDKGTLFVLEDPPAITRALRNDIERAVREQALKGRSEPSFPVQALYLDEADVARMVTARPVMALHRTPVVGVADEGMGVFESLEPTTGGGAAAMDLASSDQLDLTRAIKGARASKGKHAGLGPFVRRLEHWREHGMRVMVTARAHTQAERLATLMRHQGIACKVRFAPFDPSWLEETLGADREVEVVVGTLGRGGVLPADARVLVTEEEIFGARAHRKRDAAVRADAARPFLKDLRNLSTGDHVVHAEHGIGRYQGLVHRSVSGVMVDLIALEYGGGDKLYLPVWRLSQLEKFVGADGAAPKLDRLGGSTFARSKARVASEVRKMADELLRLYAQRRAALAHALDPADDDYRAFEATFPFDETADQARAIDDVNRDLESGRPMDRLVCGDVGFGKTEVALRAASRLALFATESGKATLSSRGSRSGALRRFEGVAGRGQSSDKERPPAFRPSPHETPPAARKEQDETLASLKDGKVDIVVGTHRLLSKDVHFKDLGLLVVDEEQRFGVTHKERMKQLRTQVDVLTLTATPIPRTLQMAVTGLRDLSLIATAPVDRRAVRTVVTRWDPSVVREAVEREISRGGQLFYVYNRVEKLHEKALTLQELVPRARIAVLHGQMSETTLEETMLDFVDGRYDVLVSTAIVESGLDIPRANTMVIDRADLLGLAQLYQLRGRVGRSAERAYCYLVVPPPSAMSDEARARVEALERHTELGSGFQIASLDLEMRGAGDLLGGEQSGNVASVGFEMFCRMLDDAVHDLRGEPIVHEVDPELSFDIEALLPEGYVADVGVRLSLYKRLASANDEAQVAEIAAEMEDRFGPPPEDAKRLVQLMALKTELRRQRALGCEANRKVVKLYLRDDTPLDPAKIAELVRTSRGLWKITPDMRLSRRFEDSAGDGLANAETALAELASRLRP